MKQIISVRDLEEMVRSGKSLDSLPAEALLTPSARDYLREHETTPSQKSNPSSNSAKSTIASS